MSAVKTLEAVARDRVGKGAARAVRRQGQVPAVIYGGNQPPQAIAIDLIRRNLLLLAAAAGMIAGPACAQQPYRLVGVDAVGTSAVGDHLAPLWQPWRELRL